MKNEFFALFGILSSIFLAVNTEWCLPAKALVAAASFFGIFVGIKTIIKGVKMYGKA